jgi:hypothetical protein
MLGVHLGSGKELRLARRVLKYSRDVNKPWRQPTEVRG